jgi:hypothetical protein
MALLHSVDVVVKRLEPRPFTPGHFVFNSKFSALYMTSLRDNGSMLLHDGLAERSKALD